MSERVEDRAAPHVRAGQFRLRAECQLGKRLCRCGAVAGRGPLRYRTFRRRHDQLAVPAVEHKQVAHLGRLDDRGNDALGRSHIDQARLRGNVHVPEVMMHGLVRPGALAGIDIQRNDGAGIALDECIAIASPDVRSVIAGGDVNEV